MRAELLARLREVLSAVSPLLATVVALQLTVVRAPAALFVQFLVGTAFAIAGMVLLFAGVDLGILKMGRFIGAELPLRRSMPLILGVAFAVGFVTTIAEPDVLVLGEQVRAVAQNPTLAGPLIYIIAAGVGLFSALGLYRIVRGTPLRIYVIAIYAVMLLLTLLAPPSYIPLAYDAGSVTTGVLTAPVVIALALGLSTVLARRGGVSDGFGLLGLASVGPIIGILLLGLLQL